MCRQITEHLRAVAQSTAKIFMSRFVFPHMWGLNLLIIFVSGLDLGLLMRDELKFMQRPYKGHVGVCGCVCVGVGGVGLCICPEGSGEIHILNAHS